MVAAVDPITGALPFRAAADLVRISSPSWAAFSLLGRPLPAPWTTLPISVDVVLWAAKTVFCVVFSFWAAMSVVVKLSWVAADPEGVVLCPHAADAVLVDFVVGAAEA